MEMALQDLFYSMGSKIHGCSDNLAPEPAAAAAEEANIQIAIRVAPQWNSISCKATSSSSSSSSHSSRIFQHLSSGRSLGALRSCPLPLLPISGSSYSTLAKWIMRERERNSANSNAGIF